MKPIINLEIKPDNVKAHTDIEQEMQEYKGKWFMFEVRISSGNIVDFVVREFIDYEKLNTK